MPQSKTIVVIILCLLPVHFALSSTDTEIIVQHGKASEIKDPEIDRPECAAPVVGIDQGRLCGLREKLPGGRTVDAYLGIPYAEPAGGQNRWRPPVPHKGWKGLFKATYPGPSCPQTYLFPYDNPESEDCLSVNVWTPEVNAKKPRAVMVFIYGGYFLHGFSGDPLYDGSFVSARGDVVVVSMNYRLGALGYLAGLKDGKTGEEINGNYGLLDQILALEWVKENIRNFGGDPGKVTIYGESAGAMSVGIHLTASPRSAGLFRAAIMQSNPFGIPFKSLDEARPAAVRFAERLGCREDDVP
ncbi:MAG TPA: carboxylesterase family protein, partial [Thermodesulfobacteriota bacterium]|nr:carboxylesterase family protein [Thermodesulfobacteriota bacterium]